MKILFLGLITIMNSSNNFRVNFKKVKEAYQRIKDIANKTPVCTSRTLNRRIKAEVFLKCENLQRMGAFKFRGAYNALSQLNKEEKSRGVITHSSGNHAQAVALSAKLLGIEAVIVMPTTAPTVKVNATKKTYGAQVVFCEPTIKARTETANRLIKEQGYTLIHPFDNDNVIAGAGTACYELLMEINDLDLILAPVGGGGLLSGTSIAAKGFNPKIEVYGIEPKRVDDAYRSIETGEIQTNKSINSIADGLLTDLSERTFFYIKQNVNGIIRVSENDILHAMKFIFQRMKLVVEPSGAVPLASLLSEKISGDNKRIGLIVSGGNLDLSALFKEYKSKIV
ncbi:MAG: L-threo-3-hydroxyaspartate ammonia-lyase [Promethearchaeota archaeon]|nr:MAG: L-threo-3-hydroxyaspartate ammonia-lyase [Candidatus Lokiarchaeota archaeon]